MLAEHQIAVNWSCMSLDWNFKRNFLTTQTVEIWEGAQNGARNANVCKMQLDKGDLNLCGEDLSF